MKVYGNLDLTENQIHDAVFQLETLTPNTAKAGRLLFRNKRFFIAAEIDGVPIWTPLTTEIGTHVHTEGAGSTSWSIVHNLNTLAPNVTVWDDTNNVIIPDEITVVDANNVTITFSANQAGRAIILEGFDNKDVNGLVDPQASGFEVLVMNTNAANGSTAFVDETNTHSLTPVNGTQHSTTQAKFGETSAFFDADAYITVNDLPDTDLGLSNQPFTIEAWVNFNADNTSGIFGKGGGFAGWNSTTGHQYLFSRAGGTITFQHWNGSSQVNTNAAFPIVINQWYHVAVTYDGSIVRVFIDGVEVGTSSSGQVFVKPSSSNTVRLGGIATGTFNNGYIDSVRIEKGYARYTASFTPPSVPFNLGT